MHARWIRSLKGATGRRSGQALTHHVSQDRAGGEGTASRSGRTRLRHDPIAVSNQNRFARRGQASAATRPDDPAQAGEGADGA